MRVFSAVGLCLMVCGMGVFLMNDFTKTDGLIQVVPVNVKSRAETSTPGFGAASLQGSSSARKPRAYAGDPLVGSARHNEEQKPNARLFALSKLNVLRNADTEQLSVAELQSTATVLALAYQNRFDTDTAAPVPLEEFALELVEDQGGNSVFHAPSLSSEQLAELVDSLAFADEAEQ